MKKELTKIMLSVVASCTMMAESKPPFINSDFESMKEALELVSADIKLGLVNRKAKCKKLKTLTALNCYEAAYNKIAIES